MAFIMRPVTLRKVEELYHDLLTNIGHIEGYRGNPAQYVRDLRLLESISEFLFMEGEAADDESQMDGQDGELPE